MTTFEERFIPTDDYNALAERLAGMMRECPGAGKVTADQIKIAIGEAMNLWPASIRPFLVREELSDRGLIAPHYLI